MNERQLKGKVKNKKLVGELPSVLLGQQLREHLLCWKRHDIYKAFPTFGIHISSATYIFEGFNLVINILKTDTNTHCLTVPKENIKGNVKYSKLVEKCIYVSPNKSSVKGSKYDYY